MRDKQDEANDPPQIIINPPDLDLKEWWDDLERHTNPLLDVDDKSLDEWLELLRRPPDDQTFVDYMFPTDALREEYLGRVPGLPLRDIQWILLKLLPPPSLIHDKMELGTLLWRIKRAREAAETIHLLYADQRLLLWKRSGYRLPPRDAIGWIIDLVDVFPHDALNVLDGYIVVHGLRLPDGRLSGLFDCMRIIRRRMCSSIAPADGLHDLSPRQLEHLVERLYNGRGYDTELTPATRDGGRDVVASRTEEGFRERVLIEVKHWETNVDVEVVRALAGVVDHERANKGVLITSGSFSSDAEKWIEGDHRFEFIGREKLLTLLAEYLGREWFNSVDRIIAESKAYDLRRRSTAGKTP